MMPFKKLFWGFLLVFLEIHIVIDILPDPIGYFMIFSALVLLLKIIPDSKAGKHAKRWAQALIILSIPTFFISQNEINQLGNIPNLWGSYTFFLGLLKIVLMFYVFQLMIQLASHVRADQLQNKTNSFMKVYLVSIIFISFLETFSINMISDIFTGIMVFSIVILLILEIYFLVLLWRFSKIRT
ncbi:MAG: hypothetical protein LPK00_00760 [Bacillaceae bacterium]|nr:hypothetical protein [Bacillaceae bacterium]